MATWYIRTYSYACFRVGLVAMATLYMQTCSNAILVWCCYGYLVLLEFAVDHDGGLLGDALADAVRQAVVTLHVSAVLVIILLLTVPIATERKVNTARHKS